MSRRNLTKNKNTKQIRRESDPIPWRYCLLTLICGLLLVVGFFFAARQHFSSMDYGIKNSRLRKQKDELGDAQRQLLLAKEIALSPIEIKKAAKKLGLTEMTAANIETFYTGGDKPENTKTDKPSEQKSPNAAPTNNKPDAKKPEKDEKPEKKLTDSKDKKEVRETKAAK
ncbi:MAG TPA: hypothetical protein VGC76_04775 [Pyrinomonadaceae bacterium]|jgi:hypothetical protein